MDQGLARTFWAFTYLAVAVSALALMAVNPAPQGRDFWVELAVAVGFLGLAQFAIQFVLIARFKRITQPYGIDAIMYYHRQMGILAVIVILAHPLILVVREPAMAGLLNPFGGNWASRTGVWSVIALVLLTLVSVFRRKLRLRYEWWRTSHAILALLAVVLAVIHIALAGPYVRGGWKLGFWIVLVGLAVTAPAYPRLIRPILQKRRPYKLTGVQPIATQTWSLTLEPVGHDVMRFKPGQFVWMKLHSPFNLNEHPFSIASSAEHPQQIGLTIREAGDFTGSLSSLQPGTKVYLDGPHGAFSIDRIPSAGYVFIAGGIGIAPILSMIRTMADRGDRRQVRLIYAARDVDCLACRDELDALARDSSLFLENVYVLEQPPAQWKGETGIITSQLLKKHWPRERISRDVLICGSDAMIVSADAALRGMGVPVSRIHAERFELV